MNNSIQRGLEKLQECKEGENFREDSLRMIEGDEKAKEIIEPTTKCNECYYFKFLHGINTCGLYHSILSSKTIGCYGGWKTRNISCENK